VELVYFGLLPHAVGQGHGGPLLTAAVSRAWALGAERVYVNSCSLDHPTAMANYAARGFKVFREEVKTKDIGE
jgi:GNAT superfamily N-acetyltransferase